MKYIIPCCVLTLSACGGSASVDETVAGPACQTANDCTCPTDYKPSCEDNKCLCLKTEVQVIQPEAGPTDTGTSDTGTVGCTADTDCNCGSGPTGPYTATCTEGMCYCAELNQECYPLKRGPFIDQFMHKLVPDLDSWQPPPPDYSDVPTNSPYYAAVEAAKQLGIMDGYMNADGGTIGTFGPDQYLDRAEGVKVVIAGIDGMKGFTPPVTPTYLDVPADAWFFNSVEAATWLDLTHGYVHQDGTPTGYFGPADTASSCFMDGMMAHAKFPADKIPRVYFSDGDMADFSTVAGAQDLTTFEFQMSGIQYVEIDGLKVFLYFTGYKPNPGKPLIPITQLISSASLEIEDQSVATVNAVENVTGEDNEIADLNFQFNPYASPAFNLVHFAVRLSLRDDVPDGVEFRTALVPCNENGFNNVSVHDEQGNPVSTHPATGGCDWINGPEVSVVKKGGESMLPPPVSYNKRYRGWLFDISKNLT